MQGAGERNKGNKNRSVTGRTRCTKPLLLCAALAILILSAGCRAGYLLHAAAGQMHLLSNAVPIEKAISGSSLDSSQRERLLLVSQIKAFGEKELGLRETRNYETIYLGSDQPPIYTVAAAPKDRLTLVTWWFPVVGRMPYLGFFDLDEARREKLELLEKNLDVVIGRADAYSTLGWFRDPLTLNLLDGSTLDLVETVLHEMTHATLFVKGQGRFNEGLAQIVGKRGALQFLEETYGSSHPLTLEAMAAIEDERLFASFLASVIEKLNRLYNSSLFLEEKLEEREKIFLGCLGEFEDLKANLKTERFLQFGRAPLNNAYLMAFSLYHCSYPVFEAALERHGNSIPEMLSFFRELSRETGDLLDRTGKWLESRYP